MKKHQHQHQPKSKKPECSSSIGTGQVTPIQVAFVVDRYLSDNSFTQTRSTFRSEASHFMSKLPLQDGPKNVLTLGDILEEYVTLKANKIAVEKERCRLEQEDLRLRSFLNGMQNVMEAYNAAEPNPVYATPSPQLLPPAVASGARPPEDSAITPGGPITSYKSPPAVSVSKPLSKRTYASNVCTPVTGQVTGKRKGSKSVSSDPVNVKKSRSCTQSKGVQSVTHVTNVNRGNSQMNNTVMQSARLQVAGPSSSQAPGSSVVKCLFNQQPDQSHPVNSSVPKTPPQDSLSGSDKPRSPSEICSTATCSKQITPQRTMSSNRTIISSETIQVSPTKQISYYSIEKNSCVSTSSPIKANTKWSNVKGRLNFDATEAPVPTATENQSPDSGVISTSESEREGDGLDFDIPNLEVFGADFDLSAFLLQFDMGGEGMGLSSDPDLNSSPDSYMSEPAASGNFLFDAKQQLSSETAGVLSDKDMNAMNAIGSDSIANMRSITKRVILSPVKSQSQRSSMDQENTLVRRN